MVVASPYRCTGIASCDPDYHRVVHARVAALACGQGQGAWILSDNILSELL